MKNKILIVWIVLVCVLFLLLAGISPVRSQGNAPTPTTQPASPTSVLESDIQNRVALIEVAQEHETDALRESNDQYRFLLNSLTGFLAIIITAGGILQFLQFRRDGDRNMEQSTRENNQDQIQHRAAQQVSDIMDVVRNTLQSRLDAEMQAREEAKQAREDLNAVRKEVEAAGIFFKNFQATIQTARNAIEENATRLVQTSRHDFRPISNVLASYAQQFENFHTEYKQLESEPRSFSSKALYIRGIAAHYSNQPKLTKEFLLKVAESTQAEIDDTDKAYRRRRANAYYYLGVTDSNFGNIQTAIDYLEQANQLDPEGTDFLTKIVNAEAYVMSSFDEFANADRIIEQVEEGLHRKRDREGRLEDIYLRLQSRASLIRVNMIMLKHVNTWQADAENILLQIRKDDPDYYYATYTLAQLYSLQNQHDNAKKLYLDAYETLEHANDLFTTTEVRSLILMRMVAGLCAKHGLLDEKKSDAHLDKADSLRNQLPRIDSQVCTVFSVLSKFNERSETIHNHIELIRTGEILLERRRRTNNF